MFTKRNQPETAQHREAEASTNGAGKGFMAELDEWLDFVIFEPIENAISSGDTKELHIAFAESKQLLKRKVLASYHNGLKAKTPIINRNDHEQRPKSYRRN